MADTDNAVALVLLIEHDTQRARTITDLTPAGYQIKVLDRIATAIARLGGGGVAAILLDISCGPESVGERVEAAKRLETVAPGVPVILLANQEDAPCAGTRPCLLERDWAVELAPTLETHALRKRPDDDGRRAEVVTFMGVKGGTGVTTLALSVAHSLSAEREIILTEVDPGFGGFREFLNPPRTVAGLWPSRNSRNLRVAFTAADPISAFAPAADFVLVDLPPRLIPETAKILASADTGVIVLERDQISCAAGARLVQALTSQATPRRLGFVLVTKVPLAAPLSITDIEETLGIDRIGVIPPAADLCAAANKKHTPLTAFSPESAPARAISDIAAALVA
jgi:Flp pilus assembly CpaE family ATPase